MEDFHPQKPKLIEHKPKGGLSITIFSMVMFVLAFTLLFSDQIIFILFLLGVLLIHELGHYIARKQGAKSHAKWSGEFFADFIQLAYMNKFIPSEQRATILSGKPT